MRPVTPSSEEVVVDSPVDHVDSFEALGGAHEDPTVHHEIAAFDQLDAHLLGQETVFEVSRVVDARGEQHDARAGRGAGRDGFQHFEEAAGILRHRTHR
jgi:hypothetical protein